jgi:hypothetical protein
LVAASGVAVAVVAEKGEVATDEEVEELAVATDPVLAGAVFELALLGGLGAI